jgi:hypothetical protein
MWTWVAWGALLIIQNASFTLVSRARNSGSYPFHAAAAVGSNGIWLVSQFLLVNKMIATMTEESWLPAIGMGIFYTTFTVIGSVGMHYVSVHYIETGKRKVGG